MSEDFISTFYVPEFHFLSPRLEEIKIEDIAHSLALLCRFGGHIPEFYSVAEHSVLVSYVLSRDGADTLTAMAGLLHDAEEAYLPDIPAPIKTHMPEAVKLYERLQHSIIIKFNLQSADWDAVHDIDSRIVITEASFFSIWHGGWEDRGKPVKVDLLHLCWQEAEKVFMQRFNYLMGELNG